MSKKVYTIQSSDKKEFDNNVNLCLELGCELLDGGYQVINNDDGVVYSQVIVLKNTSVYSILKKGKMRMERINRLKSHKDYGYTYDMELIS